MKRVVIIQARMTSSRLPGKVLLDVAGRPMLAQQIARLRRCEAIEEVVLATTTNAADDPIVELARREEVRWFRGSEEDVLSRFVGAAREAGADVVARVTADCPLLDPEVTDRVVRELTDHAAACDYASNVGRTGQTVETASGSIATPLERSFPRGLDVEVMWWDTLLRVDRMARSRAAREHVTLFIRSERSDLFLTRCVRDETDNSDLRWTVDSEPDLRLVRTLYADLELDRNVAPYHDILAYVRQNPHIIRINSGVETVTG